MGLTMEVKFIVGVCGLLLIRVLKGENLITTDSAISSAFIFGFILGCG